MNDRTYMKVMVALGEDLEHVASADEFDQDAYDEVIQAINRTNLIWMGSRRRRNWFSILIIGFLLFCLAWIVWSAFFSSYS